MKKPSREIELRDISDQLDEILRLLRRIAAATPNEKSHEKSEIVAQHAPEYSPSAPPSVQSPRVTNAPLKSLYDTAPRSYPAQPVKTHPTLGSL